MDPNTIKKLTDVWNEAVQTSNKGNILEARQIYKHTNLDILGRDHFQFSSQPVLSLKVTLRSSDTNIFETVQTTELVQTVQKKWACPYPSAVPVT